MGMLLSIAQQIPRWLLAAFPTTKANFKCPVKPGKYFLKISFLSYKEKLIPNVVVADARIDRGRNHTHGR